MFPLLKETSEEALKLLSSSFGEFEQLLLWQPLKYFRVSSESKKDFSFRFCYRLSPPSG